MMRRVSGDEDCDEDAGAAAPAARRKRKRLPGEDANLRFDEMEAYLQVRIGRWTCLWASVC